MSLRRTIKSGATLVCNPGRDNGALSLSLSLSLSLCVCAPCTLATDRLQRPPLVHARDLQC